MGACCCSIRVGAHRTACCWSKHACNLPVACEEPLCAPVPHAGAKTLLKTGCSTSFDLQVNPRGQRDHRSLMALHAPLHAVVTHSLNSHMQFSILIHNNIVTHSAYSAPYRWFHVCCSLLKLEALPLSLRPPTKHPSSQFCNNPPSITIIIAT